jgi:biopolymer transport protein ExbD
MVKTFEAIALHGTGDPEPLAKGIAQALITTQTGLVIAIPALLCHTHLTKKVDGIIEGLRQRGAEVSTSLWRREDEMESQTTVRSRSRKNPEINIAPLVDMVFLLLIFFMVTTTFSRETGIRVERPVAKTAQALAQKNILIAVTREGAIHMHEQEVDLTTLRMKVEELVSERPERAVIILADKDSKTGMVIKVMDQCRLAGANDLAIASLRQRE